ncbi:PLP-dependent transferase [Clostridium estertheticum]|nr:PLP-dependent transferase [Clostridium estertheticum]MCB2345320.1 PLP-dependent transferase [Clostridium estertheticum]MCB2350397.1 PLP-dependent transferase [Clostridium estertheticum]WAG48025.1 PLP-dependent transferase [Clostridium estertheticum]
MYNAFLNLTAIETLSLRMRDHCSNTLAVAYFLSYNSKVTPIIHL